MNKFMYGFYMMFKKIKTNIQYSIRKEKKILSNMFYIAYKHILSDMVT